jgi:hypothetical protein
MLFQIFGKLSVNYVENFRKSVLSSRFSVGFESRSIGSNTMTIMEFCTHIFSFANNITFFYLLKISEFKNLFAEVKSSIYFNC